MMLRSIFGGVLSVLIATATACASPVLVISLDGLRPADVLEADKRGLKLPNLTAFIKEGTYATGVRNALPSVTYPNHTTLITGVWPAEHGIANNTTFDPLGKNFEGWYWYSSDIKVPTLWDAVHAKGAVVASVAWPVSVGSPSIDYNLPEYWRALTADDLKLVRALSTPGLIARVERESKLPLGALFGQDPQHDAGRTRYAETVFEIASPEFMTVHLASLDHLQHVNGPDTPQARAALEALDADVGALVAVARRVKPDVTVAVVSDHGFAAITKEVNLRKAFAEAGLITFSDGKVTAWDAMPWEAGGSSLIVLARPDDQALQDKVAALLAKLAADPANGIAKVIDKSGIAARGGSSKASFWVDFKMGYSAGESFVMPQVAASQMKGTHGYFPENKEMRATFMIVGPKIKSRNLGEIDMRDIAPTLAKILEVPLPSAAGKPLF